MRENDATTHHYQWLFSTRTMKYSDMKVLHYILLFLMEYSTDILSSKENKHCVKASTEDQHRQITAKLLKHALARNEIVRRRIHKTSFNNETRIKVSVFILRCISQDH